MDTTYEAIISHASCVASPVKQELHRLKKRSSADSVVRMIFAMYYVSLVSKKRLICSVNSTAAL